MYSIAKWSFAQITLWKITSPVECEIDVRHPPYGSFLRGLKDQHAINETIIASMLNGNTPPERRRKWRYLEQYINGARNIDQCWHAVCNVILNFS